MAAADEEGIAALTAWPEVRGNGLAFAGLPPFLCWRGRAAGRTQLVLLQARELGGVVPGARPAPLPVGWLRYLDLEALARPLRRHPAFPGGVAVQVLRVACAREAWRRGPEPAPAAFLDEVLARLTGLRGWRIRPEESPGG